MKAFVIKNKFFVSLLLIALIVITSLSVYTIQKNNEDDKEEPAIQDEDPIVDPNKQAEITSMSARYSRSSLGISGNVITVTWAYSENASKVNKVYLYLNDGTPINVTSNSYFDFTQGGFDYPTGENKVKLELRLDDGKTVEAEKTVYVKTIISAKQEVAVEGSTMKVTLEYVYNTSNPPEIPETLITNNDSNSAPVVTYIDTKTETKDNKVTARTTYHFTWNTTTEMAKKLNIRWIFNSIQDSFDFSALNPLAQTDKK